MTFCRRKHEEEASRRRVEDERFYQDQDQVTTTQQAIDTIMDQVARRMADFDKKDQGTRRMADGKDKIATAGQPKPDTTAGSLVSGAQSKVVHPNSGGTDAKPVKKTCTASDKIEIKMLNNRVGSTQSHQDSFSKNKPVQVGSNTKEKLANSINDDKLKGSTDSRAVLHPSRPIHSNLTSETVAGSGGVAASGVAERREGEILAGSGGGMAERREGEEDYLMKNVANMDSLVSDLNNFLGRTLEIPDKKEMKNFEKVLISEI